MPGIHIIGGGIIGLCSAYYLREEGHDVTVVDRNDITDGCSFGNMGFISPSHFIPLASPGIIAEGFRYMLRSSSPFYIKPRLNWEFVQWAWHFLKSSNVATVKKNAPQLNNILQLSRRLIDDLKNDIGGHIDFYDKGCLMMCRQSATLEHELHIAAHAEGLGLTVERLDKHAVQKLETNVELNVAGAVLFKDDCHFDPRKLMIHLKKYLEEKGVSFRLQHNVTGFEMRSGKITAIVTDKETLHCDHVVIAAGSWLPSIAKMAGIKLLLQPGKGYSHTYDHVENNILYPAILVDARCAVTPWEHRLRIGGTMELSGINNKILVKRMRGIYDSVKSFYPGLDIDFPPVNKIWHGLRPVSPDGLPYIGKASAYDNLIIAGGHAMLGISQATGTGKIVSQLIQEKKTEIDIEAFRIERYN